MEFKTTEGPNRLLAASGDFSIKMPEPPEFIFEVHNPETQEFLFGLRYDGSTKCGPSFEMDKVARQFFDSVQQVIIQLGGVRGVGGA